jgi:hypothetical protein
MNHAIAIYRLQVFFKENVIIRLLMSQDSPSTKQISDRTNRMAKALRENLLKRKQQQRARKDVSSQEQPLENKIKS